MICKSARRVLLLGLCLLQPAQVWAGGIIAVAGPQVRLGELVAGHREADLVVAAAPKPGRTRRISRAEVAAAMADLKGARRLPAAWTVRTRRQLLSCAELRKRVADALAPSLPDGLELRSLRCGRPLVLPAGEVAVSLVTARDGAPRAGMAYLKLRVGAGRWPQSTRIFQARLDGMVKVVVSTRDLRPGLALGPGAVKVRRALASTLPADALRDPADASGMTLTAAVAREAVIRRGSLRPIPVVRKGEVVSLVVTTRGVRVTARAVARQDGGIGQQVLVTSPGSAKLVRARVVAPGRAALEL